jgi:hypothetical protein
VQNLVLFFLVIFIYSCSSTNEAVKNLEPKGKKVGIGVIKLSAPQKSKRNTDTVCICTRQSTGKALIPYLQQAGFSVIGLPINDRANSTEIRRIADSAKIDYILSGVGVVHIIGKRKDTFMEQLIIQVRDVATGEIVISSSFSATSIGLLKQLLKLVKNW